MRIAICALFSLLIATWLSGAQGWDSGIRAEAHGQANLRAAASIDSRLVGEIRAGTAYPALGVSQLYPWILLGSPHDQRPIGWVYETLVKISGDISQLPASDLVLSATTATPTSNADSSSAPAAPASPTQAAGFGVSGVVSGEVNIRYGPGVDYPRVGVAQPGQRFKITGAHTQFPWLRIHYPSLPNQQAWIARDLLTISGDLRSLPSLSQTRFELPALTATPPAISIRGRSADDQASLSAGFRILADHLWRYIIEQGFDAQTSRFGALFVMDLESGQAFSFGDDYAFSGTSINKVGILAALYQTLDDPPGITLATDIANTMICSENVASNRLLSAIGGGNAYYGAEAVSDFYQRLGWTRSFITAPFTTIGTPEPPPKPLRLPQTSADQDKANPDLVNQLTVGEMGALLASIYDCGYRESGLLVDAFPDAIQPRECRQMLHVMSGNTVDALLKAGVPADTRVAHKHGWIADTHGNAALFFTPGGDYIIVMMLYQPSWLNFQESLPVIAEVSRRVYNYFNPERQMPDIRQGFIPDVNSCNFRGHELVVDLMQAHWLE